MWWYAGLLLPASEKAGPLVEQLRPIFLRGFNKNQILLLSFAKSNSLAISSLLNRISREEKIPLSTLKLNARILKDLGLIECGNSHPARLTQLGEFLASIISDSPHSSNGRAAACKAEDAGSNPAGGTQKNRR